MPHTKFVVGEQAEVLCDHIHNGERIHGWLSGTVIQVDRHLAAVRFDTDVYSDDGQLVTDQTLWCTHGSKHIRRLAAHTG